jgi:hypothetical protein
MNWLNYPCPLLWFSFSISSLMDGRSPLSSFSHKTLTGMSKHRAGCSRVRVHSTHLNLAPPRSLPSLGSDTQRAWPGGARWMAIKTRCGWAWSRARSANSAPLPWSTAATTKENEVFFAIATIGPLLLSGVLCWITHTIDPKICGSEKNNSRMISTFHVVRL